MADLEQRLRAAVAEIEARDRELAQELRDRRASESIRRTTELVNEAAVEGGQVGRPAPPQELVLETIVLRTGRPVLAVVGDEPELVFSDAESEVWRNRLTNARTQIVTAVQAVGRIEVRHHPFFEWIGTGWLVGDDVVVTNRHVAQEFGRREGVRFVFRQGTLGRRMQASVDFLEEVGRGDTREFTVTDVLHIEDDRGPDVALLRVERGSGDLRLAQPIPLSPHPVPTGQQVAVIGYPARDSRIPDQQLMTQIFGDVFDKKRLAPGQIRTFANGLVQHDCSTLGGNSGSVVLDLASGAAVGLHFAGRFLEANFAVASDIVQRRLEDVRRPGSGGEPPPDPDRTEPGTGTLRTRGHGGSAHQLTVTIPVRITVDVGEPASARSQGTRVTVAPLVGHDDAGEDDEPIITEARPEDYVDREGYSARFLGKTSTVPLPEVVREPADVLEFEFNGETGSVLDYQHFSVVMSRPRKMCLFSAVNINGNEPHKAKRPGWRTEPRIPQTAQTVRGCYGNPPKFARGHMTRREDPMWGTKETAARGNADSMHLTNAVPQMQPFNAGIWLGLEDYALQHARQDDMRLCVFTGPVFRDDDRRMFGVKIPATFWKVIAFVHDETHRLCATGYTMSQEDFLSDDEFVFGAHKTAQTPIGVIEDLTGLSFGALTEVDPLAGLADEAVPRTLTDFAQIRFTGLTATRPDA